VKCHFTLLSTIGIEEEGVKGCVLKTFLFGFSLTITDLYSYVIINKNIISKSIRDIAYIENLNELSFDLLSLLSSGKVS